MESNNYFTDDFWLLSVHGVKTWSTITVHEIKLKVHLYLFTTLLCPIC